MRTNTRSGVNNQTTTTTTTKGRRPRRRNNNEEQQQQQQRLGRLRPQKPTSSLSALSSACLLLLSLWEGVAGMGQVQTWSQSYRQINNRPPEVSEVFAEVEQGFVGCLFSDAVCNDQEICFDDLLFGQCVSVNEDEEQLETLQTFDDITETDKALLTVELEELLNNGFHWHDLYTQCIIQNSLRAIQIREDFDQSICSDYIPSAPQELSEDDDDQDETDSSQDIFEDNDNYVLTPEEEMASAMLEQNIVPKKMMMVSPEEFVATSKESPYMGIKQSADGGIVIEPRTNQLFDSIITKRDPGVYYGQQQLPEEEEEEEEGPLGEGFSGRDVDLATFLAVRDSLMQNAALQANANEEEEQQEEDSLPQMYEEQLMSPENPNNNNYLFSPSQDAQQVGFYPGQQEFLGDEDEDEAGDEDEDEDADEDYLLDVMTNDVRKVMKRNGAGQMREVAEAAEDQDEQEDEESPSSLNYIDYDSLAPNEQEQNNSPADEDYQQQQQQQALDYIYPYDEDDVIYPDSEDMRGNVILAPVTGGLESSVFNRNERLDVKKPGPFFKNSANNFFLDKLLTNNDYDDGAKADSNGHEAKKKQNKTSDVGQVEYEMPLLAPVKDKRVLPLIQQSPEFLEELSKEPKFVHIGLKRRFDTYQQGNDLIRFLAAEFGLPEDALTDRTIENQHVQFYVRPNPMDIDAIKMAKRIDGDSHLKDQIDNQLGVDIDRVASGYRGDVSRVLSSGLANFNLLVLIVFAVSSAAAILVVSVIFILAKRRTRVGKLRAQEAEDQEKGKAQDEYKQLCRDWSRSSKKVTPPSTSGGVGVGSASSGSGSGSVRTKIQNIKGESKESEGSQRSSTSSWSEEPNAANMDISTGHMVLTYMEDHLKNKQRLDQEWVAICSYEAEPSATTIAFKAENKKKNRYPDKLPFDHNRVILNAMVNGNSSDYINASTVVDHDPRNPSYIVSQAPLSSTVADFWQMIWEQGCVVIVMLTRLQDDGLQLCHRYWPAEGSEQYHIFEVHLVSEHIWCEDYLVRSVYLKNTRTGETRTVTQFHFRSWPAHGIPTSTKALLEFRRKVNKSYRGRSCPIAVHCSDGVGRSGTYVLLDMVLTSLSRNPKEIDIQASLEHIRDQRFGMVQTKQQFEFCLTAVAEEVHAILKALPQ